MSSVPHLQTQRLILRQIVPSDAESLLAFRSDPDVQRYNGGPMQRIEEAHALISLLDTGYVVGNRVEWGVTLAGEGQVIGLFGYTNWSAMDRRAEVGYSLAKNYWHQGIAQEGMRAVLAYGFDVLDLNRIHACSWVENHASVRLLERLGFQREGVLRDEFWWEGAFHDEALYALLERNYRRG